jgi:hypothetical protein
MSQLQMVSLPSIANVPLGVCKIPTSLKKMFFAPQEAREIGKEREGHSEEGEGRQAGQKGGGRREGLE